MAKEKHGYNIEQVSLGPEGIWAGARTVLGAAEPELSPFTGQALGMLLWHKHDVEKSLADLANFTPFPDEWTVEDKVLFEQAFGFHGKCFQRIQQMVKPSTPAVAPQPLLSDEPARGPDSRVAPASGVAPPAARQADPQPGEVLLLLEEDSQPDQRDGQTGSAAGGPKGQRREVGVQGRAKWVGVSRAPGGSCPCLTPSLAPVSQ